MGDTLERTKRQLNEFYQSLSTSQKFKIGVSGLLIIVSMALFIFFVSKPEYVPLYSDLLLEDAGEMTNKLDEMGVPWKPGETGSTILVPKEYYNKAKMDLAVAGYPKKAFSYEDLIGSSSLTLTNDERNKRYVLALQNSLSSTIEEIDGVKGALVNISMPEDNTFLNDTQKSKASVFITLANGVNLTSEQVNGISMLVTNAVKGLESENISIIDNTGKLLNKTTNDNAFDASTQVNLQQQVQNQYKETIEQFLSTVYGIGNVAVMVNVKMDFDSEETSVQEFSPPIEGETTGIIRSMSELQEKVENGSQGGVPGTDSNSEGVTQYVENSTDTSKYDKANKTINYEINEIQKRIVKAQGQIKDITVAVLVNKNTLVDKELSEEDKQEIINLVSAAAGLDTKVVEVIAKEFDNPLSEQLANAMSNREKKGAFGDVPPWSLAILGALLVGGLGFAGYRSRQRKNEMEAILKKPVVHVANDVDEIDLEADEKSGYKKQIVNFVDKKPEAVAQLLKTWLNED